jgi:hypothetical protein
VPLARGSVVPIEGLLVLQLLVLLAGTAVHELGHAVAARAVGFEVAGLRVGPFLATATGRGWRLRVVWEMAAGGEVLSVPAATDRLRLRHATMIAAGPAAHLLMAAAATAAAAGTGALVLWFTAATLGLGALANLAPSRPRLNGRWTDGRWLLAWLTQPERAAQRVGLGVLQRLAAAGSRPREWDERWARLAASGPRQLGDQAQVAGCLLAYARALDLGQVDGASALLARAFAARHLLPSAARASLTLESAFFTARFRGDGPVAARLLEAGLERPGLVRSADAERARAAVDLAAGRCAEAAAACDRALSALDGPLRRAAGLVALDREVLGTMLREARAASEASVSEAECPPARWPPVNRTPGGPRPRRTNV